MTALNTPMLQQYRSIKNENTDAILFFRMGDFYEMFYEDAFIASKVLDIALTSRDKNKDNAVPMCGVPWHSADFYVAKLIKAGHKVAICEQIEDPKLAKGIVQRKVIRVITPGTFSETAQLNPKEHQYLCAVLRNGSAAGVAFADLTTGDFRLTEFNVEPSNENVWEEIETYSPSELLFPMSFKPQGEPSSFFNKVVKTALDDWIFEEEFSRRLLQEHFGVESLEAFGCNQRKLAIGAAGAVLHYLNQTQKTALKHINHLSYYERSNYMQLDAQTVRNLELLQNLQDQRRDGSLLGVIDKTVTASGGRLLKEWLLKPLLKVKEITRRLDAVEELSGLTIERGILREELQQVQDLERIVSRITLDLVQPRHLVSLKSSAYGLPKIKVLLSKLQREAIHRIANEIDTLEDVAGWIEDAIAPQPPLNVKDGNVIKPGFDAELDELRGLTKSGKTAIAAIEEEERRRTGINNLKVGYNKVFGYYIEISRGQLSRVPETFERKQTLVNAERFVTPELKDYEYKVLTAEDKIQAREQQLYSELCRRISTQTLRIQKTAALLAEADGLAALAEVAATYHYNRPVFHDDSSLKIVEGRHPCVELLNPAERFIPNDAFLDNDSHQIVIVTGPNMGGKSTFLRQTALIALLGQIGSFVPAKEAQLPIIDRIFTRIGASDNLIKGQSTFMVEMIETAYILNHATPQSLIILDEIGRGTSTFDGVAIAWAVAEFLHNSARVQAKTLFATHFHELTELALTCSRVRNLNIAIKEWNDEIIFLRKVQEGAADKSYGIQVARLAGLPKQVITRAKEILNTLENNSFDLQGNPVIAGKSINEKRIQLDLFKEEPQNNVISELKSINIDTLTPIEALNLLSELKKKLQ
ncbi:MAG: DNA mismatch repair protein MutS [Acidobacteria bacterium]|nr:MAG: DNA mismatch repair protein MutS [Acidobacteriota bacterium]